METSLDVPFQPQNNALGHLIVELFNLKNCRHKTQKMNAKQCPLQIDYVTCTAL